MASPGSAPRALDANISELRKLGNTKFWFCIISLMDTMDKVLSYKKFNRVSTLVALPIAILWAGWYVYEACFTFGLTEPKDVIFIGLAALAGGIIGGCLGYAKFYRPSMEEADNIVRQMKELKGK